MPNPIGAVTAFLLVAFALVGCDGCDRTTEPELRQAPTVTVSSPADGATFNPGDEILFQGSATRGGSALPTSVLTWRSDRDGQLGTGSGFTRSDLSVNTHVITLEAGPADGPSGSSTVTITLEPIDCRVSEERFVLPVSPSDLFAVTQGHGRLWDLSVASPGDLGPRLRHHVGLDLAAPPGRPVRPAANGCVWRVVDEDHARGFGNTVVILHELQGGSTIYTQYSHLQEIAQAIRQACEPQEERNGLCSNLVQVGPDTTLGTVGSTGFATGPHVHFEVKQADTDSLASPYGDFGYTPSESHPDERGYYDPILWLHAVEPGISSFFPRLVGVTNAIVGVRLRVGPDTMYRCINDPDCFVVHGGEEVLAIRNAPRTTGCSEGWYQVVMHERLLWTEGRLQAGPNDYFPDAGLDPDAMQPSAWMCRGDGDRWVAPFPSVEILLPDSGATFSAGELITFEGSATDTEDGDLTGEALVWETDRDGEIGTGPSLSRDDLSIGAHTVTLTATNSAGLAAIASIELEVEAPAGPWQEISAGDSHTCGRTAEGKLYCWGAGSRGQLGDGSSGLSHRSLLPAPVVSDLTFVSVTTGHEHTCALADGGHAYCWGRGSDGRLGYGGSDDRTTPVAVAGGLTFTSLTAGGWHTCGLTDEGYAYCWGYGSSGRLGTGSTDNALVPVPVAGGQPFATLSAGGAHTCAVSHGGSGFCWGSGFLGKLGTGSFAHELVPAAVIGGYLFEDILGGGGPDGSVNGHTCGVAIDGRGFCWGFGNDGQLGNGASGFLYRETEPVPVMGNYRFAQVRPGMWHTCAIATDAKAYCWGRGNNGRLGNGGTTDQSVPAEVEGGLRFRSISAGHRHTCGITEDNEAYCWGSGATGQLGRGSTDGSTVPIRVSTEGL